MKIGFRIILTVVMLLNAMSAYAYNMRQTLNRDGLSNSAILSMAQDDDGYLWIGTCDGVNIADGRSVNSFSQIFPGQALSGNIIEGVYNGGNGRMWVLTNYGLDLVDTRTGGISTFRQFGGQEKIAPGHDGTLYVLGEDSGLYRYSGDESKGFVKTGLLDQPFREVRHIALIGNKMWVLTDKGIRVANLPQSVGEERVIRVDVVDRRPILFAKSLGNEIYLIDDEGWICRMRRNGSRERLADISTEVSRRGRISDIARNGKGLFLVSFSTDGVIQVDAAKKTSPVITDMGLKVGVFCLEASSKQDVIWIGSDCQGLYTCWEDRYGIRSYDFNAFGNKLTHPIRAIFIDDQKTLWLGTKGDGLLRIKNFDESNPESSLGAGELYTSSNSALLHNSVFGFGRSSRPILWIATEEGLNYYSYRTDRVYRMESARGIRYVHQVEEIGDTLWMCTLGQGVIKAVIKGTPDNPVLTDVKKYRLDNGTVASNHFFSVTRDASGTLYFSNRGKGVFRYSNGRMCLVPLKNKYDTNGVRDVFDAVADKNALWIGTGIGLIKRTPNSEKHFSGHRFGFPNNTIHEIMSMPDGKIWISTNNGIVSFNPENEETQTYAGNYGINVTEFSDGASAYVGNTMMFGGINGLVIINKNEDYKAIEPYMPALRLQKVNIGGIETGMSEHLYLSGGTDRLEFGPKQNHFSLTFAAPDFINADNYTYYYTLNGKDWINNGPSPVISFNEMKYGSYKLRVKYLNRATGVESKPYALNIVVQAPWYLSWWAKTFYFLLLAAAVAGAIYMYLRRQRERQTREMDRMEQQHRENLYEEKLRFFTNITHEFCTPLTLIYGPCERIQTYPGTDDYISKYVGLIRNNAERLNSLIQELIDFRRMETGNKRLKIRSVAVSDLCSDIIGSFSELSDRNSIDFVSDVDPDIQWNTDFSCLRKIVTNLISNAFKYTSPGGTIKVGLRVVEGKLRLSVYNTGKGILPEDRERIFNRYSVLDNVEENAVKGLSHRNGLGMAICHSMTELLQGRIEIESEVGEFAEFIVTLPPMEINVAVNAATAGNDVETTRNMALPEISVDTAKPVTESAKLKENLGKVLVIDDNPEILTMIRDTLADYDVVVAGNAQEGLDYITQLSPDLIISDIMMPGMNGLEFTRRVKCNRHTMHIPLILLSAKTSNAERVEGIEAGADAYIGKPFSLNYLRAVAKRLLESKVRLREYYNTSASAFEFNNGKLIHREDKDYLDKITEFIDAHIEDSELSPDHLAAHMKISVRNLYRKFKEMGWLPPNDFIKNHRINYAAKLLQTTSYTVQEIIYRSGFTNRSHFYKEFDKRFHTTPKEYRNRNKCRDNSLVEAKKEA